MSDCISKDEILSPDDYGFLYGQLECNKIPADIYDKIMEGDEFTEEEERRIKNIIYERWKVLLDLEKNSLIFPKIKQPQDGVRKIVLKGY